MLNGELATVVNLYVFDTSRRLRITQLLRARVSAALALMSAADAGDGAADAADAADAAAGIADAEVAAVAGVTDLEAADAVAEVTGDEAAADAVDATLRATVLEARAVLDDAERARVIATLTLLLTQLDAAEAHDRETLRLERRWDAQRQSASLDEDETPVSLDFAIDEVLSMIHGLTSIHARDEGARGKAAARILQVAFPRGLKAHVHQTHTRQLAYNHEIIVALQGELREPVDRLGLNHLVDKLAALNPRFERLMDLHAGLAPVRFDAVKAARQRGLQRCHECFVLVLAVAWQATGPGAALRTALLKPFLQQSEQLRAVHRARRPDTSDDASADALTDDALTDDASADAPDDVLTDGAQAAPASPAPSNPDVTG